MQQAWSGKEVFMNVFQEMALSIYSYRSYQQFLKNKNGKVFGYGVLLMLIYFTIVMVFPSFIGPNSIFEWKKSLQEDVPEFKLEDGILWTEDVIEVSTSISYIYADTTPGYTAQYSPEMAQNFRHYNNVIIMDSQKAVLKNNGQWQTVYFSDLGLEFEKEDLTYFLPWLYVIYNIILVFIYVGMTALFFFGVLFVALIGMIIAAGMNVRLTFGQLYLLGIYSRTLPIIVKALVSFLPFDIPFFWVLNFGLSAVILALAINKMKVMI